jgi:predicted NUDIX family NTP pyrophosphohydrolase
VRQKSGKIVAGGAFEGDCLPSDLVSNPCEIEWPPRSGRRLIIPEIDRGGWFGMLDGRRVLRAEQHEFLHALEVHLADEPRR